MTLANTFAAKLSVAFVATAMLFTLAAPAKAQTTEELQKMINDLLAQVAALQGQVGGSTTAAGVCPFTWTRSLSQGSTGADVMKLQQFLNADAETRVAATGAGSVGMETQTFGPATAAAVSKFQVKYRADILTPAGLVNPTGYFGPSSMAKANALCTTGSTPTTPGDDEDDEDDSSDVELSGEASLDSFEIEAGDDDEVEEGQEAAPVADVTVEFTDGDAEISRLDLAFTDSEGTDSDPWDVFEEISLWVDGDEIATMAADDEDDYLGDEDDGVLRFTNLGVVGMEDEEVVITVGATIQNNLSAAELGEWTVTGASMRFFDADGVATTEEDSDITNESSTFTIEVEGAGDDLELKVSSNDPESTTLPLDADGTTEHEVFVFKLDADDSDGDITIEGITINLALSSTTRNLNEVIKDLRIEIDGESFDADDFDGGNDTEAVDFDVDGDFTLEAGEEVEVVVFVEFEDMEGDSDLQGVELTASVDKTDIDAEGESGEMVTIGGSDQSGDPHTLRSEGLVLSVDEDDIDAVEKTKTISNTSYDYGVFTFKFDVTAFGEDFYVDEDASTIDFDLEIGGVASTTGYTATLDIAGAEDAGTSDFVIEEGQTATFTLTIETNTGHDGEAQVIVNSLSYSAADDGSEELEVTATPVDAWESGKLILN